MKSKVVALILSIFLGELGIDRFYLGLYFKINNLWGIRCLDLIMMLTAQSMQNNKNNFLK